MKQAFRPANVGIIAAVATRMVRDIAPKMNANLATFDQLAEEVLELHLALRGKHADSPILELIEIAGLALNMIAAYKPKDIEMQFVEWLSRHGKDSADEQE